MDDNMTYLRFRCQKELREQVEQASIELGLIKAGGKPNMSDFIRRAIDEKLAAMQNAQENEADTTA